MLEDIKVYVIIPSYNRYDSLLVAIDSVKKQTHKNIQIIVINDGSLDARYYEIVDTTITIIHLDENSKKVFKKPCAGYVRNFGIKKALENSDVDYIAFLDDDDYWMPNKLEIQLKYIARFDLMGNQLLEYDLNDKKINLMVCSDGYKGEGIFDINKLDTYELYSKLDFSYDMKELKLSAYPTIINRKLNKKRNIIYCSSVMIHISVIKKAGLMDHVRNGKEDSGYWQKCMMHTDCFRCTEPLFFYSL